MRDTLMTSSRPDVVFDCNIYVQAVARTTGPAAEAVRLIERNLFTLHLSRMTVRELRETLADPEIRAKNPQLTDEVMNAFIGRLLFRSFFHRIVPKASKLQRDPHDEPYLDLAIAAQADYLVTRDKDLLSIATEHSIAAKELRQQLAQLSIVTPTGFLRQMKQRFPDEFPGGT